MPSRSRRHTRRSINAGRVAAPVDVNSDDKIQKFESLIGPVLVFVYADWCGHCQRYKPFWKKLEQEPNRSINMAAVRDDMIPKTSLTQRAQPVNSYPTVLLIGENGKAVNFKAPGPLTSESQSIPDHTNMETMRAIVRNAGTPEGSQILNESEANESEANQSINTVASIGPSLNESRVNGSVNTVASIGPSVSPPNIAADVILPSKQTGGSLFDALARTAYSAGPAIILTATAASVAKKQKRGSRTKRRHRRSRSKN